MAAIIDPRARPARARGVFAEAVAVPGGRSRALLPFGAAEVDACRAAASALALARDRRRGAGRSRPPRRRRPSPRCWPAIAPLRRARWSGCCGATTSARRGSPGWCSAGAADPGLRPRRGRGAVGDGGCAGHRRRRRRGGRGGGRDLTAGRRLQLACEKRGRTGFLIRRRPYGGRRPAGEATGSAAATRWRVASAPSEPPAGEFGLGAPALPRGAGTLPGRADRRLAAGSWERGLDMEMTDVAHPLRLVADLGDRQLAPAQLFRQIERRAG